MAFLLPPKQNARLKASPKFSVDIRYLPRATYRNAAATSERPYLGAPEPRLVASPFKPLSAGFQHMRPELDARFPLDPIFTLGGAPRCGLATDSLQLNSNSLQRNSNITAAEFQQFQGL